MNALLLRHRVLDSAGGGEIVDTVRAGDILTVYKQDGVHISTKGTGSPSSAKGVAKVVLFIVRVGTIAREADKYWIIA